MLNKLLKFRGLLPIHRGKFSIFVVVLVGQDLTGKIWVKTGSGFIRKEPAFSEL
jgi:hypothetical protein